MVLGLQVGLSYGSFGGFWVAESVVMVWVLGGGAWLENGNGIW